MASVPAEGTRFRALRRHAAEAQRQANAAVSGAVQAGQLSRMAAVHQDQGPPHAQHQLPLGASVRSQSPTGRLRNRRSMGSRGPYDEGAPALSLGELHRAGRGSAVERGPAVSGPPANRAAVSWGGSGSVGHADPPLYDARPARGPSDRRGTEALARPRSPDGAAPPRQHHPQRDGQDRACPPRHPSPLLPRPPSLGEMPQTSRTREVQIDPTRPPGDVEPPRGPARPAPEPRPGPHPHTPPCDLDDACRKTRKVTLTCGSGSSPQSP